MTFRGIDILFRRCGRGVGSIALSAWVCFLLMLSVRGLEAHAATETSAAYATGRAALEDGLYPLAEKQFRTFLKKGKGIRVAL